MLRARLHVGLRASLLVGLMAVVAVGHARAEEGIRRPERLTSGVSDQLLGQLSADGQTLYFVSNRNTTVEIYRQELQGRPALLFDEGADATWPRLSPDGKRILYISYRDDAGGRLCVRDLPDRRRRCLAGSASALQAQWIDATRILLISRGSLDADLAVSQVKLGWFGLSEQPLFQRNLSSPALSPDGRWLVYVPLARYLPRVGPAIASRAADRLEAIRLDHPEKPIALDPDLPGLSGQPGFSADGKYLYFTQFFNDSNQDGEIDAGDNGVLFRVPFEPGRDDAPARAAAAVPQQLTDASWNCQYPSPAQRLLIATCSRKNSLDVYSLPLDGQVPGDWSAERLDLEVDLASRAVEELLLDRRLLELQKDVGGKRQVLMSLLTRHLAASEFAAAEFYAKRIRSMPDPATAGAASALLALVEQRRAMRDRERGRIDLEFLQDARKRFDSLSLEKIKAPAALLLRRVVRSEIADAMGDKELARSELEAAPVEEVALGPFLEAYHHQAQALYRELDDREALFQSCARLAAHAGLDADDRLIYARAAARALVHGLPWPEAVTALEQQPAPPGSELEFAFKLHAIVLSVRDDNPSRELRARLVDFYRQQPRLGRKRAVLLDSMQRAVDLDAEKLVEALAKLYLDDTPAGSGERARAQRLYERAMLGRAYRRLDRGDLTRAREAFHDLAAAGSLEAHLGYVELSLRQNATVAQLEAEYRAKPAEHVVRAYLLGRQLPLLTGEEHERAAQAALDELKKAPLRGELAAEMLHGELHHERYLVRHDLNAAQRANIHYLLALELAQRNPRYQGRVLQQLALLQMQVGNYRIALDYAQERDKMPHGNDAASLAQLLIHARILFHLDKLAEAGKRAEEALQMVDKTPALAAYLPMALGRAALYALGADHFHRAAELYQRAAPLVKDARNQLVLGLARAAAELGDHQPEAALGELDRVDAGLASGALSLEWPHTTREEVRRSYRMIAAGLRANAQLLVGNPDAAAAALIIRQSLAQARFAQSDSDEHLRQLTLVEARLTALARTRHRPGEAIGWLEAALGHADDYVRRTGVKLHPDQLDLIRLAAQLSLEGANSQRVILPQRLRQALDQLTSERDPAFAVHQRWLEIDSALFP